MEISEGVEFTLDLHKIKEIPFEKYEKNFTFIVNGNEYKTNRFIADVLSPIIRNYHFIDETINTFYINTKEVNSNFDFTSILSLANFNPIKIEKDNILYFLDIFSSLCNEDYFQKFILNDASEISISNVFERILKKQYIIMRNYAKEDKFKSEYFRDNKIFQDEIDFISTNFDETDKNEIKKLNKYIIEEIIKNKKLQIKDEDSLLQFIIEIYNEDSSQSYLFEYVEYINVSNEKLLQFVQSFDIADINIKIWSSLFERILHLKVQEDIHLNSAKSKRYKKNPAILTFPYNEGDEFNGIINYLTEKTGGNIHDNKTINVTSNSIYSDKGHPKNLLDFDEISSYHSNNQGNIWICFDFKDMELQIDHYSIKSYYCPANYGGHMKNWTLEISNDGKNWSEIDKRTNCSSVNGNRKIATFNAKNNCFSRYVRLCHTGTCWDDYTEFNYTIFFLCIEFYGNLKIN